MSTHYKFSFTSTDFQDMISEFHQQIGAQGTGASYQTEGNESAWELRQSFGTWSGKEIGLRDGLNLSLVEVDTQEDLLLTSDAEIEQVFGLSFCVAGGFMTKFSGETDERIACAQQVYTAILQGDVKAVTEFAAGKKSTLVQMMISPRLFESLAAGASPEPSQVTLAQMLASPQTELQWQIRQTTPTMMLALYQILNCPYRGLTKQFYLEGKTLELIALKLNQLSEQLDLPADSILKTDDIDRIYLARDILICNLDNPPSLLALAQQSGINSLKLKKGFRQIFDTTVFGYLHTYRMEEARRLLELGGLNVTQVAQRVGYAHVGKFAATFKKKFGITPKVLKRR